MSMEKIEQELKGRFIDLESMNKDKTAMFIVDMVDGFVYSGALSSPRVAAIVENIVELNKKTKGYKKMFFLDYHENNSQELMYFPHHCVKGTDEVELISELKTEYSEGEETFYVKKNSTNGFFSTGFQEWLEKYENEVDNFIVAGCVTDICVLQFTLSLRAYFNDRDKNKRIIVPMNCVETYDGGFHDGNLMNLFALYNMHINGIEVVEKIN